VGGRGTEGAAVCQGGPKPKKVGAPRGRF